MESDHPSVSKIEHMSTTSGNSSNIPELHIMATAETPLVIYNKGTATLEMKGRSILKDVTDFYLPVMQWFNFILIQKPPAFRAVFAMEYFNTHSSRVLLEMVRNMEKLQNAGGKVLIDWYYEEEDEEMKDFGEDLGHITRVPIRLQSLPEPEYDSMISDTKC